MDIVQKQDWVASESGRNSCETNFWKFFALKTLLFKDTGKIFELKSAIVGFMQTAH